jgi:hypothetical protein
MKPTKKSEQILLIKVNKISADQENIHTDSKDILEPLTTENHEIIENGEQNYIPVCYNSTIPSISNSGWQISDIWRDIRVDNFSD